MSKKEIEELKKAYKIVFDENGEVTSCGRACTSALIKILGDEQTGIMKVETVKSVYARLTAYQGALVM